MITITDVAKQKVLEYMAQNEQEGSALRLAITGPGRGPGGFGYEMELVDADSPAPGDEVVDAGGLKIVVDGDSVAKLTGATVDFAEDAFDSGFRIDNPNSIWEDPVSIAVQKLLDAEINPAVAEHGGFVQLLEVKDGVAFVQMGGGCQGCGSAQATLKQGVEVMIKRAIPEIKQVIDRTDHASGENPYYQGDPTAGSSPLA
jgi:Fe/S biogenesis protein NfuA